MITTITTSNILVEEDGCPSKSISLDTIKSKLDCSDKSLTEQEKKIQNVSFNLYSCINVFMHE